MQSLNKNDYEIVQEVFQVLLEHLEPSKVMKFLAICKLGNRDYLALKDRLFKGETVDSLYEKIKQLEAELESVDVEVEDEL